MAPGVIADEMAGVGDSAGEFSFLFRKFADHEEGGAHIVLGEDVEKARRPSGLGPSSKVRAICAGMRGATSVRPKICEVGQREA